MITKSVNKLLSAVVVLSIIGFIIALYLVYMHYVPEASEFCTFSESFNCDKVNKSPWSYLDLGFTEIPVAIMGASAYLLIMVVSIMLIKKVRFQRIHKIFRPGIVLRLLRYFVIFSFLFSLYLTYIEAFVLYAWCLFCVAQQIIIAIIMVLFFVIDGKVKKQKKDATVCEFC